MTCPYLEYRRESDGMSFDHDRPYCTAADAFVQPMRADICNDRYGLNHSTDCEIYLRHADDDGRRTDGGRSVGADEGVPIDRRAEDR